MSAQVNRSVALNPTEEIYEAVVAAEKALKSVSLRHLNGSANRPAQAAVMQARAALLEAKAAVGDVMVGGN